MNQIKMQHQIVRRILVVSVLSLIGLAADTSLAQQRPRIPTAGLSTYETFRQSMLKAGWTPEPNPNISTRAAGLPEVICGNRVCSARWLFQGKGAFTSRRVNFHLWRDPTRGLIVAPSFEFIGED